MKFRLGSIDPETVQPRDHDPGAEEENFYDPNAADDRYFEEPKRRFGVWRTAIVVAVMGVCAGGLLLAYRHSGGGSIGGPIPLIRADQRAVKERPSNAGGDTVPNQDKYVYNPNQPDGKVEQLLPPPETPLPKPVAPPADAARTVAIPPADSMPVPAPPPAQPPVTQMAPTLTNPAPVASTSAASTPPVTSTPAAPSHSAAAPVPAPVSVATAPAAPAPVKSGAPTTLHPAASPATTGVPAAGGGVAAAAASGGGIRVQVAATRTEDAAKQEWDRVKRGNADLLGNLSATTLRADLGERGIFYRVQAGPVADLATAEKLCAELKRRNIGCILVQ